MFKMINELNASFIFVGVRNAGMDCWENCNKRAGACDWCGIGLCCKNKEIKNGCDGLSGGGSRHHCTLLSPGKFKYF